MEISETVYCRFCVKPKHSSKLLDLEMDKNKCKDVLQKLDMLSCSIDFTTALPKTVCSACYHLLTKAYMFIQTIEVSQKTLENIFLASDLKKKIKLEIILDDDLDNSTDNLYETIHFKALKHEFKEDPDEIDQSEPFDDEYNVPISQLCEKTWDSYIWSCKFCMEKLSSVSELRTHCKQSHNTCNGFKCIDCEKKCDDFSKFIKHVCSHHQYLKKCCLYCNERIITTREQHIPTHIIPPNTICNSCGEILPNSEALAAHQQLYKDLSKRKYTLVCQICSKQFKTRNACRDHQRVHDVNRKRNYTCERCGKTYFSKASLQSHMLLHDNIKPHVCKICTKSFATLPKLRAHVGVHSGAKPFTCEECGRGFRLKEQLKSHKIIHTNEMPYKCLDCGKSFRFSQILKNHQRQHTGYKPYSCDHCSMFFSNWANYNKHMVRKHKTDMAKKKITPEGVFSVNPLTGKIDEVVQTVDTEEWRNKIMVHLKRGKKPKSTAKNSTI